MFTTIATNSQNNSSYLISSEINFLEIYERINSFRIENSYLSILFMKRKTRFDTLSKVLLELGISYTEYIDQNQFIEEKWIFLWAKIVNKVVPNANLQILEYFPISI